MSHNHNFHISIKTNSPSSLQMVSKPLVKILDKANVWSRQYNAIGNEAHVVIGPFHNMKPYYGTNGLLALHISAC